ncbi:MAG: hypothetical protein OHK0050_27630 [Roseiflexaceae bacterium]
MGSTKAGCRSNTIHIGHLNIEQDDLWLGRGYHRERLTPAGRNAKQAQIRFTLDQHTQATPNDLMIIGDDDPDWTHWSAG